MAVRKLIGGRRGAAGRWEQRLNAVTSSGAKRRLNWPRGDECLRRAAAAALSRGRQPTEAFRVRSKPRSGEVGATAWQRISDDLRVAVAATRLWSFTKRLRGLAPTAKRRRRCAAKSLLVSHQFQRHLVTSSSSTHPLADLCRDQRAEPVAHGVYSQYFQSSPLPLSYSTRRPAGPGPGAPCTRRSPSRSPR